MVKKNSLLRPPQVLKRAYGVTSAMLLGVPSFSSRRKRTRVVIRRYGRCVDGWSQSERKETTTIYAKYEANVRLAKLFGPYLWKHDRECRARMLVRLNVEKKATSKRKSDTPEERQRVVQEQLLNAGDLSQSAVNALMRDDSSVCKFVKTGRPAGFDVLAYVERRDGTKRRRTKA